MLDELHTQADRRGGGAGAPAAAVRGHQLVEREPDCRIAPAEELAQPPAGGGRPAVQEPRFGERAPCRCTRLPTIAPPSYADRIIDDLAAQPLGLDREVARTLRARSPGRPGRPSRPRGRLARRARCRCRTATCAPRGGHDARHRTAPAPARRRSGCARTLATPKSSSGAATDGRHAAVEREHADSHGLAGAARRTGAGFVISHLLDVIPATAILAAPVLSPASHCFASGECNGHRSSPVPGASPTRCRSPRSAASSRCRRTSRRAPPRRSRAGCSARRAAGAGAREHRCRCRLRSRSRSAMGPRPIRGHAWGAGWHRPRVLLAHGWAGHGLQLAPFVAPLVDAGFEVMTVDQPAHGASTGRTATLPDFARVLRLVAESFGPLFAVVGHSLGGAAAAAHGDRAAGHLERSHPGAGQVAHDLQAALLEDAAGRVDHDVELHRRRAAEAVHQQQRRACPATMPRSIMISSSIVVDDARRAGCRRARRRPARHGCRAPISISSIAEVKPGLPAAGTMQRRQGDAHRRRSRAARSPSALTASRPSPLRRRRRRSSAPRRVPAMPRRPARSLVVRQRDVVGDDDGLDAMPSARACSAARPKVQAVAGVVLDDEQDARRAVDGSGSRPPPRRSSAR